VCAKAEGTSCVRAELGFGRGKVKWDGVKAGDSRGDGMGRRGWTFIIKFLTTTYLPKLGL